MMMQRETFRLLSITYLLLASIATSVAENSNTNGDLMLTADEHATQRRQKSHQPKEKGSIRERRRIEGDEFLERDWLLARAKQKKTRNNMPGKQKMPHNKATPKGPLAKRPNHPLIEVNEEIQSTNLQETFNDVELEYMLLTMRNSMSMSMVSFSNRTNEMMQT